MKNGKVFVLFALILIFFSYQLYALSPGPTWKPQVSGTASYLNSVAFIDRTTGWVVGNDGTILKSTDGGVTWVAQRSGTKTLLWSVDFLDAKTGWAGGGEFDGPGGVILKTRDGGSNWVSTFTHTNAAISSIDFIDNVHGWAVGGKNNVPTNDGFAETGTILASADGGENWKEVLHDGAHRFFSVKFVDSRTGWVVGDERAILKTQDGGLSWKWQKPPAGSEMLRSVFFLDANRGWAVGYPAVVLRTTNGGVTWAQERISARSLAAVYFIDALRGWAVSDMADGDKGVIFATVDGGVTWTSQNPGIRDEIFLNAVCFLGPERGWAVGSSTSPGGIDSGAILLASPNKQ